MDDAEIEDKLERSRGKDRLKVEDVHQGVSVSFLAQVFRMDAKKVKERLAQCPRLGATKAGYSYDLATASAYLVTPRISIDEYVENIKPADMPPTLQNNFWTAALKRQEWEENARDLWRTEAVRDVLGSMFQKMKFTMQLWIDALEEEKKLEPEHRKLLRDSIDGLQAEMYEGLVEAVGISQTRPQLDELPDMIEAADKRRRRRLGMTEKTLEDDIAELV